MWLIWILNYSVFFFSVVADFSLFTLATFLYGWSRQCPTMINTQLISLPNFLIHQFIHPKNTHTEKERNGEWWHGCHGVAEKSCTSSATQAHIGRQRNRNSLISSCKLSILWVLIEVWIDNAISVRKMTTTTTIERENWAVWISENSPPIWFSANTLVHASCRAINALSLSLAKKKEK